jgi:hypothetical protein
MVLYADDINILVVDKDENTLTCKIPYLMKNTYQPTTALLK